MGRKNSLPEDKTINQLIAQYEEAKAEGRQLYLDPDQLTGIADQYAYRSYFQKAQEVITYGLYLHPGNTDLLIEQAYLYLDRREIDSAQQVADCITEEYDPEVKILKAELLLNRGEAEAANDLLNTIDVSESIDTFINIVYLFLDLGYPEIAKEWLDKGETEYGEEEDFMAVTADYLATTNQLEEAALCYDRLIDNDPYNASYWVELAKCRFAEEKCEKAIEACDFALAADEKCGEAYAYRAHCFFYLGNSEAAITDYQKAIECKALAPEMGYMLIAVAYMSDENWEQSDLYFRKVIQAFEEKGDSDSPLLAEIYTNKAKVAFELGNREEAHLLCEKAKAIHPEERSIYLAEGKFCLAEGLQAKAAESFKLALKYDSSAEIRYLIGSAYTDFDMLKEAKAYYKEAYKANPHYADVIEKLSAISLIYNEIDDFFKYNAEAANPISETVIADLLSLPNHTEEGKQALHEVLKRMKNRNNSN